MIPKVKIQIEEEEWAQLPQKSRERILELMNEYGYDTNLLQALEDDIKGPTPEEIFKQFYGEEDHHEV